jgi:hypothetical protein
MKFILVVRKKPITTEVLLLSPTHKTHSADDINKQDKLGQF